MNYTGYFGLIDLPFSIAPNPQYLYMSERHREALAHLLYGIQSDGGFVLLTGEVGTGKTTVCRCLLEQVPADVDIAFLLNPKLTVDELLAAICDDFGIEETAADDGTRKLVARLNDYLLDAHRRNRKCVLIIDEAQNLSAEVLEQLRLLTNLETNQRKLLQIILLGQPELLQKLQRKALRQLSQRITARFHLVPLDRVEADEYIQHRLAVAGGRPDLFPGRVRRKIFRLSRGIPRVINLICDRALLGTYVQQHLQVEPATVDQAAAEIFGSPTGGGARYVASAAAVVIAVAGALYLGGLIQPAWLQTTADRASRAAPAPEVPVGDVSEPVVVVDVPPHLATVRMTPIEGAEPMGTGLTTAEPNPLPTTEDDGLGADELRSLLSAAESLEPARAFTALFSLWGGTFEPGMGLACEKAVDYGLRCAERIGSLREIKHIDRPAILRFRGSPPAYGTLAAHHEGTFTLIVDGTEVRVRESALATVWSGNYTLLWRTPPAYRSPSRLGDRGEPVGWLAAQLANIDGGPPADSPELLDTFGADLDSRVRRFQLSVGLVPDGIVGVQTWIHINNRSRADVPRLQEPADGNS